VQLQLVRKGFGEKKAFGSNWGGLKHKRKKGETKDHLNWQEGAAKKEWGIKSRS